MLLNPDDDEPAVIEEESMAGIGQRDRRGLRNIGDREPEREPDYSAHEGNIGDSNLGR